MSSDTFNLYGTKKPPGNLSPINYEIKYFSTREYNTGIQLTNQLTYCGVNVPRLEYYQPIKISGLSTKQCVIILCGGGGFSLSYDPETSEAIEYWKTKNIHIFALLYRNIPFQNNLQNDIQNIYEIYNPNSTCFLFLYDLDSTIRLIQTKYGFTKFILHGFSGGGGIVSSYTSIVTYNDDIMNDIREIVEEESMEFPSLLFKKFITNLQSVKYPPKKKITSSIIMLIMNYPYLDHTIPQSVPLSPAFLSYLTPIYAEAIYPLNLLYSKKLQTDGVSDPVKGTGSMSMLTKNHPPVYIVHTQTDPFLESIITTIYCKNLLTVGVPFTRIMYAKGGHGWGMGGCFCYKKSFPPDIFPHGFYKRYVIGPDNIKYGSDFVNGHYISKNSQEWFTPPFQGSTNILSLDEFYIKYSGGIGSIP